MTNALQRIFRLGKEAEFFRGPDGRAYATVQVRDHHEHCLVRSKQFTGWLSLRNYKASGELATQNELREVTKGLETQALFEAPVRDVPLRVGELEGHIFLDLCDSDWQVVEIGPDGWRVIAAPHIKFRRADGMLPLPVPVHGGSINELRPFVNVENEADWKVMVGVTLAMLRPRGPFPLLNIFGPHRSAKSTTVRVLRALVDPNRTTLRGTPSGIRDLMIAALANWVLAFDNLSAVSSWFSDALCQLSTGAGFGTRQLHTDTQEVLFEGQRPAILTCIGELPTRSDLLDRCVNIELPPISDNARRSEAEFWASFEAVRPRVLGALLDAVSQGVRDLPHTNLENVPRMADFAVWVSAAEENFGWEHGSFLAAYEENREAANDTALEASPITAPLFDLLSRGRWQGTAAELLKALANQIDESTKRAAAWPKTEAGLSVILRRLAPNLRSAGIEVEFVRATDRKRTRTITLGFLPSAPSAPSETAAYGTPPVPAKLGLREATLEQAGNLLHTVYERALEKNRFTPAVAAVRELINIAKLIPPGSGALETLISDIRSLTDEQLEQLQQPAAGNGQAISQGGEAASGDDGKSS